MDKGGIKILGADDNAALRALFQMSIENEPGFEFLGWIDQADSLLEEVERTHPDIVLLDLRMPGKDPLVALKELAGQFPEVRTVVMSGFDAEDMAEEAIDAGAWGYVSKNRRFEDIVIAIRKVANGEVVVNS